MGSVRLNPCWPHTPNADPVRIERDAERDIQAAGENRYLLRLAIRRYAAEYLDVSAIGFRQEDVALGAVRINRGLLRPVAYNSTLKPLGAFGQAFSGRGTILGAPEADCVANGAGRSLTVIRRVAPGFSKR
jgi:hypothetical protein